MQPVHQLLAALFLLVEAAALARVLLRPHREPAARIAWLIIVLIMPVVGIGAYLLFGEARISARRRQASRDIERSLPRPPGDPGVFAKLERGAYGAPFALARSVNRLDPTAGNRAHLAADSNAAIREIVADIDSATESVHASFYIWLGDTNGFLLRDAFVRAARRGVAVRVLADALGSRLLIRSRDWAEMKEAGVDLRVALPVGNPLWTVIRGRVDLRNHRKAVIVDNRIGWCGSQNAADPEFRVKPRYAPWVDVMTRWDGPIAAHLQYLFVCDWMAERGSDISSMLGAPCPSVSQGAIAQVIGTGPSLGYGAMTACFAELIHAARRELVITTPYFVPDEQLLFALTSAGRRGVKVRLLLPARNDSRIVAAASRSYYADLLNCGVEIFEYGAGLLHAKTMVADNRVALIGSANLDRRSFELNFENNILFDDAPFAQQIRARQDEWLADCRAVTIKDVEATNIARRLWQNLLATAGPLL